MQSLLLQLYYVHIINDLYCRTSRGKLDVEVRNKNPLQICICVDGEDTLTTKLTEMVNKIWHEKIDFKMISDKGCYYNIHYF